MSGEQSTWHRGDWMQTYTGRQFYPLAARPEDISEQDIAHALSMICRYGGHIDRFYSVAEHCYLLSYAVPEEYALWALLHDATEAYVGDMVRALKHQIPAYVEIEDRLMGVVAEAFGLECEWTTLATGRWTSHPLKFTPHRVPVMPQVVKDADNRILLDERTELFAAPPAGQWAVDGMEPLGVEITGWDPEVAEYAYRQRFDELMRGAQ